MVIRMKKRELIRFLKEHPQKEISAAVLADFQFRILLKDDVNKEVEKVMDRMLPADRLAEDAEAAKAIEAVRTPEELLRIMRKPMAFSNLTITAKKALAMQDEAMPLIISQYRKTKHTIFIENAAKILSNADRKYTGKLLECYKDIWLPYAQALACLLFGYHGLIDTIPLQLSEYERFIRLYPDESYDQCPLMALSYLVKDIED